MDRTSALVYEKFVFALSPWKMIASLSYKAAASCSVFTHPAYHLILLITMNTCQLFPLTDTPLYFEPLKRFPSSLSVLMPLALDVKITCFSGLLQVARTSFFALILASRCVLESFWIISTSLLFRLFSDPWSPSGRRLQLLPH